MSRQDQMLPDHFVSIPFQWQLSKLSVKDLQYCTIQMSTSLSDP